MSGRYTWLVASLVALALCAGLAQGQSVNVNFQLSTSETPEGYLPDGGAVFGDRGNGFSYGWDRDISADARDRGSANAEDQRYDTLNHVQKATPPAVWEIELENGEYNVFLVCGDPDNTDQTNTMSVEGVILTDPDGQDNFDDYTVTVVVEDGRLTITASADDGASNAKISFVEIVLAKAPEEATAPSPEDASDDLPRDVVLGWTPGDSAVSHDVYFGTDFDAVAVAEQDNPMDVLVSVGQSDATYDAGVLEFGTTYFWRVDETLADGTIARGEVWSLTTEPYAYAVEGVVVTTNVAVDAGAEPENMVNGSGLNADDEHSIDSTDMWLGKTDGSETPWLQFDLGGIYKLHEMLVWNYNVSFEPVLGFGPKDVTIETSQDGAEWTVLGDVELAQATATADYVANTAVDFEGVAAQFVRMTIHSNRGGLPQYGLSEVRFLYIPVMPREPQPAAGATNVGVDTVLAWRSGREAATHEVYFGTDPEALELADTVSAPMLTPAALDYGAMYYWQVIEVNEAEALSRWEGDVWDFATQEYAVVDDFESYNNDDNVIYETWIDGWVNDTGSTVGYLTEPFAETTIVHGGGQSMPLLYDNTGLSTAEADLSLSQNWAANGIKSLSLYVYGDADNTGQLYLEINGSRVDYTGNITTTAWLHWAVDLSTVGNVSNVNSLTIGIEGSGATGVVYIDDIRLYPKAPEFTEPTEPDAANLMASYQFEGNADDSSGNGLNGALVDAEIVSPGKQGAGMAVQVNDAGYVDLGNPASLDFSTGDWTVTAWYKTGMTGTGDDNKGTVYGKGGDTGGGHRYCLIMSETTEGVMTLVTDDDSTKVVVNSTSVTNDDEWHAVAGQRKGSDINIFIDGLLEGTGTAPDGYDLAGTVQHNAYIGAITNHGDSSLYKLFIGLIDDVRVYDTALSEGEILWLAGKTDSVAKPF